METPKFKINQVCFDSEAKELVKISNGTDIDRIFTPTEAIAIRVFPPGKKKKPKIAFTYRQVKAEFLHPLVETPGEDSFDLFLNSDNKMVEFIGRV